VSHRQNENCCHDIPLQTVQQCRTPRAFRTDFQPDSVNEDDLLSGRHRTVAAEGAEVILKPIDGGNLALCLKPRSQIFQLNRGAPNQDGVFAGFQVTDHRSSCLLPNRDRRRSTRIFLTRQYIADEPRFTRLGKPVDQASSPGSFWLAARKTTESPSVIKLNNLAQSSNSTHHGTRPE
jgi:hypothetical protein